MRLLTLGKLQQEGMGAPAAGDAVRVMSLATIEAALPEEIAVARAEKVASHGGRERWLRIVLAPGLELSVREGDLNAERIALDVLARLGR